MNNISVQSQKLIEESYLKFHSSVLRYIHYKIGILEDAEDLAQDVFLRLMDYKQMICAETIKHFVYTISRNLVTDYLRRHYKKQEITSYMYETSEICSESAESKLIVEELAANERHRMALLPPQRRIVYQMNRFEEKNIQEIAVELNLSPRTVENHLFISRKEVRDYMRKCI